MLFTGQLKKTTNASGFPHIVHQVRALTRHGHFSVFDSMLQRECMCGYVCDSGLTDVSSSSPALPMQARRDDCADVLLVRARVFVCCNGVIGSFSPHQQSDLHIDSQRKSKKYGVCVCVCKDTNRTERAGYCKFLAKITANNRQI